MKDTWGESDLRLAHSCRLDQSGSAGLCGQKHALLGLQGTTGARLLTLSAPPHPISPYPCDLIIVSIQFPLAQ